MLTWRRHDLSEDNSGQNVQEQSENVYSPMQTQTQISLGIWVKGAYLCLPAVCNLPKLFCTQMLCVSTVVLTNSSTNTHTHTHTHTCWSIRPAYPSLTLPVYCKLEHRVIIPVTYSFSHEISTQSLPGNLSVSLKHTHTITHNFPFTHAANSRDKEKTLAWSSRCVYLCVCVWVRVHIWLWQMSQAQLNGLWLGHIGF